MTTEQVINKWKYNHPMALEAVLAAIEKSDSDSEVRFPYTKQRKLVTTQIFNDFGYILKKVVKINGEKSYCRYVKKNE